MEPAQGGLTVATPERVALSLPVAGIGFRSLAYLTDVALLSTVWVVAYFAFSLVVSDMLALVQGLSAWARGAAILGFFACQWIYWTLSEVLWDGRTLGKRLLRIRVVRQDGAPTTLFDSAVRNLCRMVDFLPLFYAVGALSMLLTGRHQRVGDLLAGTVLIRDERIDLSKYASAVQALPVLPSSSHSLQPADVELLLAFVSRAPSLLPAARERLGRSLVAHYGKELTDAERAAVQSSPQATEAFLRSCARGGA